MSDRKKILVVDDEEKNRELLEAMLIPLDYSVDRASDGEEALKKVADNPPDLILLDVMMPRMNGFEVAKRLKTDQTHKIIPIVMVTALKDVENKVKAIANGVDDFLSKPVDSSELKARVNSLLKVKEYNDHMIHYQKKLEQDVRKRTLELQVAFTKIKKASLDTIYRLSRAAEYKDDDTGAHLKRMSNYSAAVARKLGLQDKTVESILYAAPMHDVGKIGIPDRILLKPGKLDPAEWETMKLHVDIGVKILEGAEEGFLKLAEVIAHTHHEKWDGTGYPNALKATAIPLAGRIVAIADVFDALTSKRPYKEPFSVEKSIDILKQSRGNHFDPDVVDAFLAIIDEVLVIKDQFRDEAEETLLSRINKAF